MTDGKSSMNRKTKAVFAVVAVAIMILSVIPLFSTTTTGDPEGYQREITYNSNNGGNNTRTITYDGIASTEYNPEFWEGTGHVPASITVYIRAVYPTTGELVTDQGEQVYEALTAGTDIGNLDVYVNSGGTMVDCDQNVYEGGYVKSGGTMVAYDPFVYGNTNNWKGEAVNITGIQMTGVTLKAGMGTVALSSDLTITAVSPDTGVTFSNNTITYSGGSDLTSVTITVTLTTNKVFAGWNTSADGTGYKYLPGDIILPSNNSLYAQWITPDVFVKDGAVINSGSNTVFCKPYFTLASDGNGGFNYNAITSGYTVIYGDDRAAESMYGTIYKLSGSYTLSSSSKTVSTGTYRSLNTASKATLKFESKNAVLSGDVIIDGVHINAAKGGKHLATSSAIFASGHVLIMGVGIDNPNLSTSTSQSDASSTGAPSIYGGSLADDITGYITSENIQLFNNKKRMVFTEKNGGSYIDDYYIATCVIVHSGLYKVIAGGSSNRYIGQDSEGLGRSTYIVLRGGSTGDAVYGGGTNSLNSGQQGEITAGTVYADTRNTTGNPSDIRYGGSFVYVLGHFFSAGDDWQDKMTGNLYKVAQRDRYNVLENTIVSGGTHKKNLYGTSHLFISDNASLWVTNAANREHIGYTRVGMLDVSGSAVIRHIAAGTTANASKTTTQDDYIKGVWLYVRDNATVALALGGGYDIWQDPDGRTMVQGTINVYIKGGTVGNVYGGGYRGSIGTPNSPSSLTVNVTVDGGTIIGNVYGGGSGGTDRGQHKADGTWGRGGDTTKSEGKSYVYGNVNVNINGGTVNGNVYGGGMSVPVLQSYTVNGQYEPASESEISTAISIGGLLVKTGEDTYRKATKDEVHSGTQLYTESHAEKSLTDANKSKVLYVDDGEGNYYAATNAEISAGGSNLMIFKGSNVEKISSSPSNDNYVAEVQGKTTVNVSGGNILGSVYGGGEGISMTKVGTNNCAITKDYTRVTVVKTFIGQTNTIDKIPWFVNGDPIYKTVGAYNTYLNYARVDTGASVNITGNAHISGSVFGGGCSGFVDDDRTVNIACESTSQGNDYNVDNSIYGGSSEGNDNGDATVIISAGKINGSVFGGGFMGVTTGNTYVYLGYVLVNGLPVPQDSNNKVIEDPSITITDSVFAGANVKDDPTMEPYTEMLVNGKGYVYIDGTVTEVGINGSIMGDGNSCLTGTGEGHNADIYLCNFDSGESELTGIHRAKKVTLESSIVKISGKEARVYKDGNKVVVKTASLFRIEDLTLKDGTILSIDQPAEDVRNYSSLNASNDPTVSSSPLNRIIFTSGSSFYIREEKSPSTTDYGTVSGYTIISVTDQATFGAYVLGEPSSGGFVIMKNGLYESANISDFRDASGNDIRCWFISGMERKVITMELDYTGSAVSVSSGIDVTKLQSGSDIRFSGGDYVSAGTVIDFASSGFDSDTFGLKIGSIADNGSALIMNNSNHYLFYDKTDASPHHMITGSVSGSTFTAIGYPSATSDQIAAAKKIYYSNDGGTTLTQATTEQVIAGMNLYYSDNGGTSGTPATTEQVDARSKMCYSSDNKYYSLATTEQLNTESNLYFKSDGVPGTFRLNLQFMGNPDNETNYLGYILLNIFEIQTFMVDGTAFELIVNQIEIRVDMYVQGDQSESNVIHDITIDTVDGVGSTDILVPSTHTGQTLKVTSVLACDFDQNGDPINTSAINSGIQAEIDIQGIGNISGTNGWKDVGPKSSLIRSSLPITVGTLSGGYVATMRISVDNYTATEGFVVICTIYDSSGAVRDTITINVLVVDHEDVEITFIDSETSTTIERTYGSTLLSADCPSVSPNFIGWYVDQEYTKAYNFSLPLTTDLTLYARYDYVVTFDYMDGSTSTMNVPQNYGGVKIPAPSTPTRTGYTFAKTVSASGWYKDAGYTEAWNFNTDKVTEDTTLYAKWNPVQLTIEYYDGLTLKGSQTIDFGTTFGNKATCDYSITRFDHWTCNDVWIYTDTVVDSNITIDWVNNKIILKAEKYQENSETLYIMMDNSVGKLYYSTDEQTYTEATPKQIEAREHLYYSDDEIEYTQATSEQISAAMSMVRALMYTKATSEQITAGADLRWSDDGVYFSDVIPSPSDPNYTTDKIYHYNGNALEFTYTLNGASRTGYNLNWWFLDIDANSDGIPDFTYRAGTQVTIKLQVELSGDDVIVKKVYLNNTLAFEYNDNSHKLDDPTDPYYITFQANWVLIDYNIVLSNTDNTEGDHQSGVSQFVKNYDGTIHLEYIGEYLFSKWTVVGDYDPTSFDETQEIVDIKVRGDCVISAVELSGQQVRIYVNFDYGDGTSGRIDDDARPSSIYISYDETTLKELKIVPGAHLSDYDLYKGQIRSLDTDFEIYINRGTAQNPDFCLLTTITYTPSYTLTLEEILVVISTSQFTRTLDGDDVTCTDLTNTIESSSQDYYDCCYGDGQIGTVYFITGSKSGDIVYQGNSVAVDNNIVSTVDEYAGSAYFTVTSTTQNVGESAHLQRTFYINVKPRNVFIIGVTEWTQQGENWGSGDTFVIYNDDGHAEDRMSVSSTARPSVQTPGVTVNVISYTFDSRYSVTVINGMYIVVKSDASTVCVDVIYDAGPLHASMSAPLSVDQISEKAKLESAANIMAVINHSMGRRL